MTTPPSVPQPPQAPVTGLDDLEDMTDEVEAHQPDGIDYRISVVEPGPEDFGDPAPADIPDSLDARDSEGAPAPKPKRKQAAPAAVFLDWEKMSPRKEDDFASVIPQGVPGVVDKIRDFLNTARERELYDLLYPIAEYANRNSPQAQATKINSWRKGQTNRYGVRDGEDITAKVEKDGEKFILWVGLMRKPDAKAFDRDFVETPEQMEARRAAE